ncbi:thiamine biosynthesis protein ThiS [archaeon]|jgi:sulfur carrier protein ThiS|nr:thiamine biosynthesis protein ThiS [archaeon]MBT6823920.1 thiamine biosynthesis protein ThiS [archaeon]MBT7106944.1 thiamine biosynthesis protein ThiS [archaeon]MBT7297497.1 thiamine biosynthesis protein ThiS [archaeon]
MKIKVFDEKSKQNIEIEANTIKEISEKLNIGLGEVIIVKNGELVTEKAILKDQDELKFLSVVSGG